eukprot:2625803-Ditylum_brightwellii.AAC.1
MGICNLPHKRDYWSTHRFMPSHKTIELTGMPCKRFDFIWWCFHMQTDIVNYQDDMSDTKDETDEDKDFIEQTLERAEAHKDTMDEDNLSVRSSESNESANNQPFGVGVGVDEDKERPWKKHAWYYKIKSCINH